MKDHWYWSFNFNLISFLSIKMISQQTCERLNWMKIKECYCFIIISSWIFLVQTQSLVNSQIVKPVIVILAQFLGSVGFKMSLIWFCFHHQWLFTILEYTIGLLACHEIRMKLERRTVGKGWLGVTLISPTVSNRFLPHFFFFVSLLFFCEDWFTSLQLSFLFPTWQES